jgi:hypothetical protein
MVGRAAGITAGRLGVSVTVGGGVYGAIWYHAPARYIIELRALILLTISEAKYLYTLTGCVSVETN